MAEERNGTIGRLENEVIFTSFKKTDSYFKRKLKFSFPISESESVTSGRKPRQVVNKKKFLRQLKIENFEDFEN